MIYEDWIKEPRLIEIELDKRIDIIAQLVSDYLVYRNIGNDPIQQAFITDMINKELIRMPNLKPITIQWGLVRFTDPLFNNVSAAIIIEYLRKAYNSEIHKEIMRLWHKEEEIINNKRLAESTISTNEQKNKDARIDSFNRAVESVKNNSVNLNDWFWKNAYLHLAKDLEFKPDQDRIDWCAKKANEMIEQEIKIELANPELDREKRSKSTRHLSELLTLEKDPDLQSRIDLLRKKLITMDYITKGISKQIEKQTR